MTLVVKNSFTHRYGHGGTVEVPAGARIERPVSGEPGVFWVDPSLFPKGSLERHDATYYGIRVPRDNVEEQ